MMLANFEKLRGRVVNARDAVPFGDNPDAVLTGTRDTVLVQLGTRNRTNQRRFAAWCAEHGAWWSVVDSLRNVVQIECTLESIATLVNEPWALTVNYALNVAIPHFATGSGELSESAARFAKLNRHQQRFGVPKR